MYAIPEVKEISEGELDKGNILELDKLSPKPTHSLFFVEKSTGQHIRVSLYPTFWVAEGQDPETGRLCLPEIFK
jgi:hypothetical protein